MNHSYVETVEGLYLTPFVLFTMCTLDLCMCTSMCEDESTNIDPEFLSVLDFAFLCAIEHAFCIGKNVLPLIISSSVQTDTL